MTSIPEKYKWLNGIYQPNTIKNSILLYGTQEYVGPTNNPQILEWAKECGISYASDDVPWCGLFVAVVVKRSGWEVVKNPLWARSWLAFGTRPDKPGLGDVLVFSRDGGGHVGFYIAEDAECYHVIGGNQSDSVSITRIKKSRLLGARRPIWKIKQPDSVKQYFIESSGAISTNEN